MQEESRRMQRAPPLGVLQLLRSPEHRAPLGVAVMMHLSQQLSGINAVSHRRSPEVTRSQVSGGIRHEVDCEVSRAPPTLLRHQVQGR
ncbi:Solute carrier family 2, facilitated glucose transporter member 1 [Liparis tanakae]|uniref:Solute carrier family 2, facilitated glucose transporter member 1 n=1 Tax=Liparis tanakae TaxID=230148 RepID=A0A4Z2DZ97_9TELE|nr:Solute carrier family 2, facilitated glucose transporter member 1 [Liparis tanakae]